MTQHEDHSQHHLHHPFEEDDDVMLFEDPLPGDPCLLFQEWLDFAKARSGQPNWNTIMLATATPDGKPSVRAVLLKAYDPSTGMITFYTNYSSRKAVEIEQNPQAAICMHWDHLERQVRVEGRVQQAPAEISDAYFASRRRESQIGAWASEQSRPLAGWEELLERVIHFGTKYGTGPVPRPPHWGGYLLVPHRFEFWHGLTGRVHERIAYELTPDAAREAMRNLTRDLAANTTASDGPALEGGHGTVIGGGAGTPEVAPVRPAATPSEAADAAHRWQATWVNP